MCPDEHSNPLVRQVLWAMRPDKTVLPSWFLAYLWLLSAFRLVAPVVVTLNKTLLLLGEELPNISPRWLLAEALSQNSWPIENCTYQQCPRHTGGSKVSILSAPLITAAVHVDFRVSGSPRGNTWTAVCLPHSLEFPWNKHTQDCKFCVRLVGTACTALGVLVTAVQMCVA